jgi:RHS repeat-associated protein
MYGSPAQYAPLHYKFTGKERDAESGLDNFKARYFGSSLGRFMTPDPLHVMKQKLIDPQQWNMYAYVRNNPLRFTDPTGMYTCSDDNKCKTKQYTDFEKGGWPTFDFCLHRYEWGCPTLRGFEAWAPRTSTSCAFGRLAHLIHHGLRLPHSSAFCAEGWEPRT